VSEVRITRTTALYPSAVFIQWDVRSSETGDFFVDVARAESPKGPWETIATGLRDAYNFVDNRFNLPPSHHRVGREPVNLFSLARVIYYQLTVIPPSGLSNAFKSEPTPVEPGLDRSTDAGPATFLLKRKLLHDQAVGYRRLNGIPIAVLKRRRWGDRCPKCYDPVLKESTQEHCLECYGTAFRGGYWAPVFIRGRREAAAVETQVTAHGDSDVKLDDFNVLDYPLIEYKDLLVDLKRNDRYQVQRVHQTELKSVTVHQKVTTSMLGRNAIEYRLYVDPHACPPLY
jgi:hypothetical protein